MKRFLLILTAIATILSSSAAKQNSTAATPTNSSDSLSIYLGRTQGAMLLREINSMGPMSETFKKGLTEGLGVVFNADTTNIGYLEGINMGLAMLRELTTISRLGGKVDRRILYSALAEKLKSGKFDSRTYAIDSKALGEIITPLRERQKALEAENRAKANRINDSIAKANESRATLFLDSLMKADKSIKLSSSGLAYKIVKKGKGNTPANDANVTVNYVGTTIDGNEFDSSQGEPRTFNRQQVIKGFSEGIGLMNKGARYILYIPGKLAYGPTGVGNKIGPNEMLIFDIELVDFEK